MVPELAPREEDLMSRRGGRFGHSRDIGEVVLVEVYTPTAD